jgi:subtilase family serine protease
LGPYTPSAVGTHNLRCKVDVNSQINESNENNNKEVLFQVVK